MTGTPEHARPRRPDGPPPGIVATVGLALTVASVTVAAALSGGEPIISPMRPTADVANYYFAHRGAAVAAGFFTFGTSVPIGIFAATVYSRQLKLGIRVPGPKISFFGGIAASVLVGLSGLATWVLGQHVAGQPDALIQTIALLAFAAGGPGFVVAVGLLIAGIAVPGLILGLVPRWLAWIGLILAALSELSLFSLLLPHATVLLPVGRFLGLLWLVVTGFLLPRNRHQIRLPAATRQIRHLPDPEHSNAHPTRE
jgi:hypothetical protein